ncbi:MAG: hemolysin family protein [Pseudobdellovibrionaceae bacterium]
MEVLLVVLICLLLNALLSAAEMAFVSVSKPALRERVRQGDKKASLLLKLRQNPERTLSVMQIGITMVGAVAAAVGGAGAEESLTPYLQNFFGVSEQVASAISITAVVIPLTLLSVVLGELVPKSLALRNSWLYASVSAPWILAFDRILSPIVDVLEWSTKKILRLFFRDHSIEKIEADTPQDGTVNIANLTAQHRQYILNLVNIEHKKVRDILLDWNHVIFVDRDLSLTDVERVILSSGHTRLPVIDGDKVMGVINSKEFLALKAAASPTWDAIIRPILEFNENTPLISALRQMQEKRSHLALVYNFQRNRIGIVTLEDIIEEVIGDVYDEDDDGVVRKILSSSPRLRSVAATKADPKKT